MRASIAIFITGMLVASVAKAGIASGAFNVSVDLKPNASGLCISTSLSQQTNALVKVTCQGGQFVSIEQREGRPFVGVHGGAYRYVFSGIGSLPADLIRNGDLDDWIGRGTVTTLRVLNLTERDERLELLVSF
jgi:hypothetical protein